MQKIKGIYRTATRRHSEDQKIFTLKHTNPMKLMIMKVSSTPLNDEPLYLCFFSLCLRAAVRDRFLILIFNY